MSQPPLAAGPVERAVLASLAPTFHERTVPSGRGVLRILEGGTGTPLVLLHGRGNAAASWFPLLPHLARTHRVLAADLPGFGSSTGHAWRGGRAEAGLAFFVDPIENWLAGEGIRTPRLMGHSLGGLVAIELALRGRVTPSALALVAAMGVGPEIALAARLFFRAGPERLARALGPRVFGRISPHPGPDGPRAAALAYELLAVPGGRPDASAAFDTLVPLAGPAPHRRARLHAIDVPALVLWGEHDPVLPAPLAIAAAGALPRSVLRIEPAGHSPHTEDPARTAATLDGFFAIQPHA